jgi:SPASM domain peptide maturase of grasp-with-spasm system
MNLNSNKYFALFPCCKVVDGKNKSAIYDLQRETYVLIPLSLSYILKHDKHLSLDEIFKKYPGNEDTIEEYMNFLYEKDLGTFFDKNEVVFKELSSKFQTPHLITNAIFDYDSTSSYDLQRGIKQLHDIGCEDLEIRFYDKIKLYYLSSVVAYTKGTCIRDLELLFPYSEEMHIDNILKLRYSNPRIRKVTISGCPPTLENIYDSNEIYIIYTTERITSEEQCGVISPWYMLPKTELYLESLTYNNCLNQKISIDRFGNIKNCPSMGKSYGLFDEHIQLSYVINNPDFQKMWHIRKDDIKQCKDCELRYMCQDCRAYVKDNNDPLSTPLKCTYNPYSE